MLKVGQIWSRSCDNAHFLVTRRNETSTNSQKEFVISRVDDLSAHYSVDAQGRYYSFNGEINDLYSLTKLVKDVCGVEMSENNNKLSTTEHAVNIVRVMYSLEDENPNFNSLDQIDAVIKYFKDHNLV